MSVFYSIHSLARDRVIIVLMSLQVRYTVLFRSFSVLSLFVQVCAGLCIELLRSGLRVVYGSLVVAGLPQKSYRGHDKQSDTEACQLLNPRYLSTAQKWRWDDLGCYVWTLKASLASSLWSASAGFQPTELLENAATCNLICI